MPDARKLKDIDCEFRARLAPGKKNDYWWRFEGNGVFGTTSKSVAHLCQTYDDYGRRFFELYGSLENLSSALPLSLLKSSKYLDIAGGVVPVRGALTMARIYKHTGNKDLQRQYANCGLQILGSATVLKEELECLAI